MLDFFGWYEAMCLALIGGAYIHGTMQSALTQKKTLERGIEMTLDALEKQGIIRIDENGEIAKAD
jgi:hypothetical protein